MRFVKFIANNYTDARVRKIYLERLGVVMGEGTYTNLGFRIVSDDYKKRLFIGKNVSIAPNVTFVVMSSANNGKRINEIPYVRDVLKKSADIIVEDEVWIGANVTVLPGVHIGECSVIGAGSVVTKDVEPYSVYAGVPARKIRDLRDNP
jgi:maltose O-acetyltransferase